MASVIDLQRPQFRHYPLQMEQLRQLHEDTVQLDQQIRDNNNQIKILNGKIARSDYEQQLLERLKVRDKILQQKHRELTEIVRTQSQIEQEMKHRRQHETELKNNLANEYKATIEEKRRKQEEQKKRQIEMERNLHYYNQNQVEQQLRRKRVQMQMMRRTAQQQIQQKQQAKMLEKEQQNREKIMQKGRTQALSHLESQKQTSYRQYYQQFIDQQNRLHNIYQEKAEKDEQQRQQQRNDMVGRGIQETHLRQMKEYEDQIGRQTRAKEDLRLSLQRQIEEKEQRKLMERQESERQSQIVKMHDMENKELLYLQKQRRLEDMKRYEEGLNNQVRVRESLQQHSPSSNRGYSLHNPITNPIDFKIGINNPYVVQTYEDTKGRYFGQPALKLRNLAMIGNKSLGKWAQN